MGVPQSRCSVALHRLQGIGSHVAAGIGTVLTRAASLGQSASDVAQGIGQVLQGALNQALTVARNGIYDAFRDAFSDAMQSDEDIVGWVWTAQLDADPEPCAACIAMHGTVHDVGESMDSHVNCRCEQTPLTRGEENTMQTGEEWFDGLDEGQQQDILGPGKFEAYQNGVDLSDMVGVSYDPKYGRSIYEKPLKDL
jgi:hypothetical protein